MKIPASQFLEKYKQLLLSKTKGIETLPYWKMKYLIETGEIFHQPSQSSYYIVRNNHLLMYYSPDSHLHLSTEELNNFDCISLPAAMFETVEKDLMGFNISKGWSLRYDFNFHPKENTSAYEAVDFNFSDQEHFAKAAEIIGGTLLKTTLKK